MANYTWDAVLSHVARKIGETAESTVETAELVPPPQSELGDLAFGCFKLAKEKGKNPAELAKELAGKFGKDDPTIENVQAAGPYLNINLRAGDLAARVIQEIEHFNAKFGSNEAGKGRELMLEYANQNTHKEVHIGHLRLFALGSATARILQFAGWKVVTAGYHGDIGAHVAKCLWFLVRQYAALVEQPKPKKAKKGEPEAKVLSAEEWTDHVLAEFDSQMVKAVLKAIPADSRNGRFLGALYSESTKLLEENPGWKEQVSKVQQKLEAQDPAWNELWRETRHWSQAEFLKIYEELGMNIDKTYFESEMSGEGQKMVDELQAKKIAKESQGAIIVDLEEEKLGVFLVRKSDGTSLYSTKDLALAFRKVQDYPKLDRSLVMIDTRQSLYFKQLFRTLQKMGLKQSLEMLGFEFVTLKSGAMSSRQGNVVTYEGFRDEVLAYAKKETRERHADWPEGKVEHVAWCLGLGGIKYGMLKQDSDKVIVFDLEKALSFDGDTGPYIQYAATRLNSILKKAGWNAAQVGRQIDRTLLKEKAEKKLALKLAQFPSVCARAAEELKPMVLAQWCFTAAQACNEFYRDVPVIEAPTETKAARLELAASAASVLILGLNLLGIPLPEEM